MAYETQRKGVQVARKCILCGDPSLSGAPMSPEWLYRTFPQLRQAVDDHAVDLSEKMAIRPDRDDACLVRRSELLCTQCCAWKNGLEDEVRELVAPALRGEKTQLSPKQIKILGAWLCLVTTLTAFFSRGCGVSPADRCHLRHNVEPPQNWSIFVGGLRSCGWSKGWRHDPCRVEFAGNSRTGLSRGGLSPESNTQLLSIGVGALFFHVFTSPSMLLMHEFGAAAKARGLEQMWPRTRRFGVLPRPSVQIPSEFQLSDEEACDIAKAFVGTMDPSIRYAPQNT